MKKEPDQITSLLRAFVHLTPKEIEDYLTQSLDENSKSTVEEHLESCPRCAREVRIIWENIAEDMPGIQDEKRHRKGWRFVAPLFDKIFAKSTTAKTGDAQIVGSLPPRKSAYTKLWIGQRYFKLEPVIGQRELLEAKGLSISRLLSARDQERKDPGTNPVAIEGPGMGRILTLLTSFTPAGNFIEAEPDFPEEFEADTPPLPKLEDLHIFSKKPSHEYESMSSVATERHYKSERFSSIETPASEPTPELILTWEDEAAAVEILKGIKKEKVFLRIREKVNPVPHHYH